MGSRLLLGAPLVLLSAGCTISMRAGPEVRAQPSGAVLEGRGTFTMGLGSASGEQGTQLAAAYLGRDVRASEPPYLRVRRARPLSEIARESWWDGCVGEGAAAQVVFARAADAHDLSERRALRGIARDERGHARLAADVVTWAAKRGASA